MVYDSRVINWDVSDEYLIKNIMKLENFMFILLLGEYF